MVKHLEIVNLNGVTTATNGSEVNTMDLKDKTVFVSVTGNTGAVTVTIQGSYDGSTWFNLNSNTYSSTNTNAIYSTRDYMPSMRVITSSQTSSTVTAVVSGRD